MYDIDNLLFKIAEDSLYKEAVVPPAPDAGGGMPMDPAMAAMGGGMPMDPSMAAMGGGMPMDPSMAAMGGGMPMDPAMAAMGGAPAPMAPEAAPAEAAPASPDGGVKKLKPEEMMQKLEYRLYNMQQLQTLIIKALNIDVPPDLFVTPPGETISADAALPEVTQEEAPPSNETSAISPISPIQGASPELAAAVEKSAELAERAGYRYDITKHGDIQNTANSLIKMFRKIQ